MAGWWSNDGERRYEETYGDADLTDAVTSLRQELAGQFRPRDGMELVGLARLLLHRHAVYRDEDDLYEAMALAAEAAGQRLDGGDGFSQVTGAVRETLSRELLLAALRMRPDTAEAGSRAARTLREASGADAEAAVLMLEGVASLYLEEGRPTDLRAVLDLYEVLDGLPAEFAESLTKYVLTWMSQAGPFVVDPQFSREELRSLIGLFGDAVESWQGPPEHLEFVAIWLTQVTQAWATASPHPVTAELNEVIEHLAPLVGRLNGHGAMLITYMVAARCLERFEQEPSEEHRVPMVRHAHNLVENWPELDLNMRFVPATALLASHRYSDVSGRAGACQEIVAAEGAGIDLRMRAALLWTEQAAEVGDDSLSAWNELVALLEAVASGDLPRGDRERFLSWYQSEVANAAALALTAARPADALDLLERARSLLWAHEPGDWRELSASLGTDLAVVVSAGRGRGDMIVVGQNGPQVVRLPGFDAAAATDMAGTLLGALRVFQGGGAGEYLSAQAAAGRVLARMWKLAAEPLLTEVPDLAGRRVVWCPVGVAALLPWHAAGPVGEQGMLSLVTSSYTTSLRALTAVRRGGNRRRGRIDRLLTVAVGDRRGSPVLDHVPTGIATIRQFLPDTEHTVLLNLQATREEVLREFAQHRFVHFACHAVQDSREPSRGGVVLADGILEALDLSRAGGGELAFLSACGTAWGGTRLLDEAIHPAAALFRGGFAQVVGTLWPVVDAQAAEVAAGFYSPGRRLGGRRRSVARGSRGGPGQVSPGTTTLGRLRPLGRMKMTDPYLALLVGEPEGSGQARIEVGEADATTLARLLQEMFARRLDIDRVELVTHGRTLGVAGRNRLARMLATVPRGPGDSDLGRLPGVPSYDLILFECGTCGQVTGVVHVDERTPPVCAAGHGPLQGPV